jgi:hypothetical protein
MNNFKRGSQPVDHEFDSIQKCETETVENSSCRSHLESTTLNENKPTGSFGRLLMEPSRNSVSAFEEDRVIVADDSSRRTSLIENIYR